MPRSSRHNGIATSPFWLSFWFSRALPLQATPSLCLPRQADPYMLEASLLYKQIFSGDSSAPSLLLLSLLLQRRSQISKKILTLRLLLQSQFCQEVGHASHEPIGGKLTQNELRRWIVFLIVGILLVYRLTVERCFDMAMNKVNICQATLIAIFEVDQIRLLILPRTENYRSTAVPSGMPRHSWHEHTPGKQQCL